MVLSQLIDVNDAREIAEEIECRICNWKPQVWTPALWAPSVVTPAQQKAKEEPLSTTGCDHKTRNKKGYVKKSENHESAAVVLTAATDKKGWEPTQVDKCILKKQMNEKLM